MKKVLAAAAVMAVAFPAAAAAAEPAAPSQSPAQACKAQRASMGTAAFAALYGTNKSKANAFGKCVAKQARATEHAQSTGAANAAKQCKAEQADANFAAGHGGKTFDQVYGTNKNGKNAYGKCVSGKAKTAADQSLANRQRTLINGAKACKAERTVMGAAAFKAKYGTGRTKANAFGKCVSAQAHAKS